MIASIIDDGRCGMSDVAFHTASPTGGLSCQSSSNSHHTGKYRFSKICNSRDLNFEQKHNGLGAGWFVLLIAD